MTDQAILYLARPDPETLRRDNVVIPANETDIAIFIHDSLIAGRHPVADELVARGVGVAPVFEEHHRIGALHRNLPGFARFQWIPRRIDNRNGVTGDRSADGARLRDADRAARRKDNVALRLAVKFVDNEPERRLAPLVGFRAERFTARTDRPHIDSVAILRIWSRAEHTERSWRNKGVADLRPRNQREGLFRIEFLETARHHGYAVVKAGEQNIQQSAGPSPVSRSPDAIAWLWQKIVVRLDTGKMADQHPVAMQSTFRLARRAGRIDHHRRIIGRRVNGRKIRRGLHEQISKSERTAICAVERNY